MEAFAGRIGRPAESHHDRAEAALAGFGRFWNAAKGYCYDVLDGPRGYDDALRPNQIFAVSLPDSPLSPERQRAVVDACAGALLTSHGLRSLAPPASPPMSASTAATSGAATAPITKARFGLGWLDPLSPHICGCTKIPRRRCVCCSRSNIIWAPPGWAPSAKFSLEMRRSTRAAAFRRPGRADRKNPGPRSAGAGGQQRAIRYMIRAKGSRPASRRVPSSGHSSVAVSGARWAPARAPTAGAKTGWPAARRSAGSHYIKNDFRCLIENLDEADADIVVIISGAGAAVSQAFGSAFRRSAGHLRQRRAPQHRRNGRRRFRWVMQDRHEEVPL